MGMTIPPRLLDRPGLLLRQRVSSVRYVHRADGPPELEIEFNSPYEPSVTVKIEGARLEWVSLFPPDSIVAISLRQRGEMGE